MSNLSNVAKSSCKTYHDKESRGPQLSARQLDCTMVTKHNLNKEMLFRISGISRLPQNMTNLAICTTITDQ